MAQSKGPTVAKIGDVEYDSLAAVNALTGGETIELVCDYTADGAVAIDFMKSATLDLGGYTLTISTAQLEEKKFAMGVEEGDCPEYLTITNGTMKYEVTSASGRGLNIYGGTLNIDCTILQVDAGKQGQPIFDMYPGATVNIGPTANITAPDGDIPVKPTIEAVDTEFDIAGGTMEVKGIAGLYYSLLGSRRRARASSSRFRRLRARRPSSRSTARPRIRRVICKGQGLGGKGATGVPLLLLGGEGATGGEVCPKPRKVGDLAVLERPPPLSAFGGLGQAATPNAEGTHRSRPFGRPRRCLRGGGVSPPQPLALT